MTKKRLIVTASVLASLLVLVVGTALFRYFQCLANMENFGRIKVGMTRDEVVAIMGREPEHQFQTIEGWKPESERKPIPTIRWADEWCGYDVRFALDEDRVVEKRLDECISHPRLRDRMKALKKRLGW
jgi:hypothetical protein